MPNKKTKITQVPLHVDEKLVFKLAQTLSDRSKYALSPQYYRERLSVWEQEQALDTAENLAAIAANQTMDSAVREAALHYLEKINNNNVGGYVCLVWVKTRSAELGELLVRKRWVLQGSVKNRVLTHLLQNNVASHFGHPVNDELKYFVKVATDKKEKELGPRAEEYLRQLPANYLSVLALIWLDTKAPLLLEILEQQNYQPSDTKTRVWLALHLPGRAGDIIHGSSAVALPLLQATIAQQAAIAQQALRLLPQITDTATQSEICRLLTLADYPQAQEIALAQGWQPANLKDQALYWLITEQWAKYDILDFDGRILRLIYQTADSSLRKRIAEKIRNSGQSAYLYILTGGAQNGREKELTSDEADILVKILTENQNWERLWELLPTLPLKQSREAVLNLAAGTWQPPGDTFQAIFAELLRLAQAEMLITEEEVDPILAKVIKRSQARVVVSQRKTTPEKLKTAAFAYRQPWLALAAANNRVVLWNLQSAKIEKIVRLTVERAISLVVFTETDILCMAERTSKKGVSCGIYRLSKGNNDNENNNDSYEKIGEHNGVVTSLLAVGGDYLVSTGSDGQTILWDVARKQQISQHQSTSSVGGACLSQDRKSLVILHKSITILALPELKLQQYLYLGDYQLSQKATFAPDGTNLIFYKKEAYTRYTELAELKETEQAYTGDPSFLRELGVSGASYLPGGKAIPEASVVITVHQSGKLTAMEWPGQRILETIKAVPQNSPGLINNLEISPDNSFLALLDTEGQIYIYDLRLLMLRQIFIRPLACLGVRQLNLVRQLQEDYPEKIPAQLKNALDYVATAVSRLRLHFAIELDEITTVQAGEFDIEIEG